MLCTDQVEEENGWLGKVREIKTRLTKMASDLDAGVEKSDRHFQELGHELVKIDKNLNEKMTSLNLQMNMRMERIEDLIKNIGKS